GNVQTVMGHPTTATHTYADGTIGRTITATATDEDDTFTANSLNVTVNNVAPTVGVPTVNPPNATAETATSFSIAGTFSDPAGAADAPFSAIVYWGDGGNSPATVSGFNYSFSGSHTYLLAGNYSVTVAVTDKDTLTGTSAAASVTVT